MRETYTNDPSPFYDVGLRTTSPATSVRSTGVVKKEDHVSTAVTVSLFMLVEPLSRMTELQIQTQRLCPNTVGTVFISQRRNSTRHAFPLPSIPPGSCSRCPSRPTPLQWAREGWGCHARQSSQPYSSSAALKKKKLRSESWNTNDKLNS